MSSPSENGHVSTSAGQQGQRGEIMLRSFGLGLLVLITQIAGAPDTSERLKGPEHSTSVRSPNSGRVCGSAGEYVTILLFGSKEDTVCSVSYTNKKDAPGDGLCNKSAFPSGCTSYQGGMVLSIGKWAKKTNNPMVQTVLENIGLGEVKTVGGLFLDIADGAVLQNLYFLSTMQSISDTGLQVLGSPTLDGLPGLRNVSAIDGDVFLVHTGMANLTSMAKLSSIGKGMVLIANSNLTSLAGMENLITIGGTLMFADNNKLQNLSGLEKLVAIGITPPESAFSGLSVTRNKQLTDLRGLDSLVSIGGQAAITDNPRLASLDGLERLANVNMLQEGKGVALHVEHNWRLQDIKALSTVARCSGPISTRADEMDQVFVEVYPQRRRKNVVEVIDMFHALPLPQPPSAAGQAPAAEPPVLPSQERPIEKQDRSEPPGASWRRDMPAKSVADMNAAPPPRHHKMRHHHQSHQTSKRTSSGPVEGSLEEAAAVDHAIQTGAPESHGGRTMESGASSTPHHSLRVGLPPPTAADNDTSINKPGAADAWDSGTLTKQPEAASTWSPPPPPQALAGLQRVLPQLRLPNFTAAVASAQAAFNGLPVQLPRLLGVFASVASRDNVTLEEGAERWFAALDNRSASMDELPELASMILEDREAPTLAGANSTHGEIPPGFLVLVNDPESSSGQMLKVVDETDDTSITTGLLFNGSDVQSYLVHPSGDGKPQSFTEGPARRAADLKFNDQGASYTEPVVLLGTSQEATMTAEPLQQLFLDVNTHHKGSAGVDVGISSAAKGAETNATDLVVYRCTLATWNDVCKYIASPSSVDAGTDWISSGVCSQVFPQLPGSPPLVSTLI